MADYTETLIAALCSLTATDPRDPQYGGGRRLFRLVPDTGEDA